MDQVYLEKVDPSTNTNKYWEAAVRGNQYWCHWGRIGTKGQRQRKTLSSHRLAAEFFDNRVADKRQDSYKDATRPEPLDKELVFNSEDKNSAQAELQSTEPEYYLAWSAKLLKAEQLLDAAALTQTILNEGPFIHCLQLHTGYESLPYVSIEVDDEKLFFGFPPEEFINALSSRERTAVLINGTSRDGWLALNGNGSGIITTDMKRVDYPARLFLTILHSKSSDSLEFNDSCETSYGSTSLILPFDVNQFEWHPDWDDSLKQSVQEHWFLEGQVAKIRFVSPFNF